MGKKGKESFEFQLRCPSCGNYTSIQRASGSTRANGHLKNFHCPYCESYQKFTEVHNYDEMRFLDNDPMRSTIKIYHNQDRVRVNLVVTPHFFKIWSLTEEKLVSEAIITNSDYNLIENLILNFINNETGLREKVVKTDRMEIYTDVVLSLNIKKSILDLFTDYCDMYKYDKVDILRKIVMTLEGRDYKIVFPKVRVASEEMR